MIASGKVKLVVEPENSFDNKAIAVYINDNHVGYIAKNYQEEALTLVSNE
jgi:hypothetical protein